MKKHTDILTLWLAPAFHVWCLCVPSHLSLGLPVCVNGCAFECTTNHPSVHKLVFVLHKSIPTPFFKMIRVAFWSKHTILKPWNIQHFYFLLLWSRQSSQCSVQHLTLNSVKVKATKPLGKERMLTSTDKRVIRLTIHVSYVPNTTNDSCKEVSTTAFILKGNTNVLCVCEDESIIATALPERLLTVSP